MARHTLFSLNPGKTEANQDPEEHLPASKGWLQTAWWCWFTSLPLLPRGRLQGGGIAAAQGLAYGLMPAQVREELPGAGRTLLVNWRLMEELPSCCKMHSGQMKPRPPHAPGGSARAAAASREIHLFQATQWHSAVFWGSSFPVGQPSASAVPCWVCLCGFGPGAVCYVAQQEGDKWLRRCRKPRVDDCGQAIDICSPPINIPGF